ncbi:VanZ family protein [Anabaena cylindrica FACHB-243]|uniref:VanZ family protein n=1 Tax=Anabaena cylindrica (strain ATCC 27899 / PCC 7122) TaxID=272123 RepID=K9ZHL5_ANACC|nr:MULTISPECIES: VanZ family protein [Anabaena]AFZ58723.1 VanZ family protein [Anabaena cylindrica PCC 7122]MBD2420065.1 VanZ family protein [Anabaena cylindrica FACHB-243]MBY5282964.1 VanZ family protein [Anabaena sp. CCAP 1446/1C]MBY5306537.1 VanZ family protein [Anabaena sp. CCAP 1446/1C]MCM2407038.1 VanZ family protein [Anabaena sp. CCAP 1446/1C]
MTTHQRWVFAFWVYLGILLSIFISAYLRIMPTELAIFAHYDTIMHFLLLGMAAYLGHQALNQRKFKIFNIPLPLAPFIVLLVSIIDEIVQSFVPYRSADITDLAADILGIIVFTWLAEKFPKLLT